MSFLKFVLQLCWNILLQERDIQTADGLSPQEILHQISETAHAAIERQYQILNEQIFPQLREEGISFLRRGELTRSTMLIGSKNIFRNRLHQP